MENLAPLVPWLIGLGGFLVLLWSIRGPLKFIYEVLVRWHQFLTDWYGDDEQASMPKRMVAVETSLTEHRVHMDQQSFTLNELRHELKPNGGSSMNDRLTRVEKYMNPDAPDNH